MSHRVDASGLVPDSEAWFAYYEREYDRFESRAEAGDDVGDVQIPLAAIDRIVAAADRAASERRETQSDTHACTPA